MIRLSVVLLFCVTSISACIAAAPPAPRPQAAGAPTREDTVYAAVLDHVYSRAGLPILLLADSTRGALPFGPQDTTGLRMFERMLTGLPPELLADFKARNADRFPLRVEAIRAVEVGTPVALITAAERQAATEDSMGVWLFQQYPGADAVITLSRVGFSPDRQLALVHEIFSCGPRCGGTQLMLAERRTDGRWTVRQAQEGITF